MLKYSVDMIKIISKIGFRIMKVIIIDFDFIARNQTANKKNGKNRWVAMNEKNKLLSKCILSVNMAKIKYSIDKTYFGCRLHRYWMFNQNRSRDYDNFCSGTKYYTDALKHAKLIQDDSNRNIINGDVWHFSGYKNEILRYVLELIETKEDFKILFDKKKEGLFINSLNLEGNF